MNLNPILTQAIEINILISMHHLRCPYLSTIRSDFYCQYVGTVDWARVVSQTSPTRIRESITIVPGWESFVCVKSTGGLLWLAQRLLNANFLEVHALYWPRNNLCCSLRVLPSWQFQERKIQYFYTQL